MKVNRQEFVTIQEMAKKLDIPPNTVKQRLFQHNIKPVSKDALYDLSALDAIKNTAMGRPKKAADQHLVKPNSGKTKPGKPKPGNKAKPRKET